MDILVPIDGSDPSERALRFAIDLVRALEGSLQVVHFTDAETDATAVTIERANELLEASGIDAESTVSIDVELGFRSGNRIGDDIVSYANEHGFDHVVMGHHGSGTIDRLMLGSAAETVLRSGEVPVTVIP